MKYLKHIPWLIVVIAISWVAWSQYQQAQATRALLFSKNAELQQAKLEIGKAKTTIVKERDLHKTQLANIDKQWKEEIKAHQALITQYATLEAKYKASKDGKIITVVDLPKGQMYFRAEDGKYHKVESLAWSYHDFRITIQGDVVKKTISYQLHQTFKAQAIQTKTPTGATNHYVKFWEVDPEGKEVGEVTLTKFEVFQAQAAEAHMMWWNPKVDLAVSGGVNGHRDAIWNADIGISLSGYGKTTNDLSWRFFRLAAGVTGGGAALSFSPATYNIAQHLPLFSNIWLVPSIGYDIANKTPQLTLGIGVVF